MSKRIVRDGKFFRVRKGREVEIPTKWVGNVTFPQTIRKRPSKLGRRYKQKVKRWLNPKKDQYAQVTQTETNQS